MKTVFIAHQISGDVEKNLENAWLWVRWAITRGVCPVAPYLYFCQILDENKLDERKLGIDLTSQLIPLVDEFWICGPVPKNKSQVWIEYKKAAELGIKIVDYTGLRFDADPS